MKNLLATAICLVALIIAAMPVDAQTRYRTNRRTVQNSGDCYRYDNGANRTERYRNDERYRNERYRAENYDYDYDYDRDRSVWDKHRDKITTAGGAAGGAILGGLIGGKKGAIIGAITGGAGAAIYTYKIRDKNGRY